MYCLYNYLINELNLKIDNPFRRVKYKKKAFKRNIEQKEFEEILSLLDDEETKLVCKITYYAGLRIAEAVALQKTDIKDSSINVDKQFSQISKTITPPKSKNSVRVVPIPEHLNKSIKDFIKNKKVINIGGDLFTVKAWTFMRNLRVAFKDTDYEGVTFHYFRHSYITRLVQNGLDLKTTAYLAGDKLETIVKTYIHLTKDTYSVAENFVQKFM